MGDEHDIPEEPEEPVRRSSTSTIGVSLGAVALLVAGAVVGAVLVSGDSSDRSEGVASLVTFDRVSDFYEALEVAVNTSDAATLFDRLHPEVIGRYGAAQCQASMDDFVVPGLDFQVSAVGGPMPWMWEHDGQTADIADAVVVRLSISAPDGDQEQETHVAVVEGEIRWFTDCGDPI